MTVKAVTLTMSKYTTEVRYICEAEAGLTDSVGYNNVQQIIDASWQKIFSFDFPIFDEAYRPVLCKKILKHFYTREIGLETVGLWKLKLDTKLNEIMPYYNRLYEVELKAFNPLYTVDLTTTYSGTGSNDKTHNGDYTDNSTITHEGTNNVNTTTTDNGTLQSDTTSNTTADGTSNTSSSETTRYSDTPQGAVPFVDLEGNTYLTNATIKNGSSNTTTNDTANSTVNNTQTTDNKGTVNTQQTTNYTDSRGEIRKADETTNINSTEEYTRHVMGINGTRSYAELFREFRDTIVNLDMAVIGELNELFMGLW